MVLAFLIVTFLAQCAVQALSYVLALAARVLMGAVQAWCRRVDIPPKLGGLA